MSKLTERIYARSPIWLQQVGINAFGWYWARRRLGPVFERTWRDYAERETWPPDRMQEFIESRLRLQVKRAYQQVPYYRNAFRAHGIEERLIERMTIADLSKLPLLEKRAVRHHPYLLLTESAAQKPPKCFHTSGTTGTPIRAYWSSATHQHNMAVREA